MSMTRRISLWVAPQNARDLFGRLTDSTVTFESGGTLWVPAQPDQHLLRGLRYTASGTAAQLQQLSAKLINQCLTGGQHLDVNAHTAQWLYLNNQDTVFGPFTGTQLCKWANSGIWTPDFPICHGPSGTWLPLWLALQLMDLSAAAAINASAALPRRTAVTSCADDGHNDAEMLDWTSEVMAELRRLRQDSAFLQELSNAVDMDWEPQQKQNQQGVQDVMHLTATDLAAESSSWLQQEHHQQVAIGGGNSSMRLLLLVIDTNVLLDSRGLPLLLQLQDLQQQRQEQHVLVVIPWTVLVELDKLKARHPGPEDAVSVATRARAALRHLHMAMAPDSCWRHMYKAQSIQEFRAAAREFDLGVSDKLVVADDRILQCALNCQQQQQLQQGNSAVMNGVLLLTNDTAFRLKAQANSVPVASLRELPIPPGGQQHQEQEQLVPALRLLAGLTANGIPGRSSTSPEASKSSPAAAVGELQLHHSMAPAAINEQLVETRQQPLVAGDTTADNSRALHHITSLRLGLSSCVTAIFQSEYEQLWLDVVSSRPPWRDTDFLHVLHKHWRSTLQDHLLPAARHNKKQLEVAVQYLLDVNKQLHHRFGSSSRGSIRVQPEQLQQNVAVRVIQLLEGFGAAAAAADVAAAAGLEWTGSSPGTACDRPRNSNNVCNVLHQSAGLSQSTQLMSSQHRHQFSGSTVDTASGVEVQQVQDRAAQQQVGSQGMGWFVELPQQQGIDYAVHSGRQSVISPAVGNAASATVVTSPQHRVHAVRHSQAHASANTSSAADDSLHNQHQQGASSVVQTQQRWWQQTLGNSSQVMEQQHMHISATQGPHITQQRAPNADHHQQAVTVSWVAAACAAVPAPTLQGPCFRLQQLIEYSVALVQAATPALQQLQQVQPAAAAEASSALRKELQDLVQLIDHVTRALNMQLKHQHQQGLDSIQVDVQESLLQLGLQMVKLCCCLLADTAAYDTVAGQLTTYRSAFVADAVKYLLQQQREGLAAGVPGTWQLRAVLEQLY